MPAVLRNGRGAKPETTTEDNIQESTSMSSTGGSTMTKPSPYLLLLYPIILSVGSLFSILSPIAAAAQQPRTSSSSAAPLAPGLTSDLNTPYIPPAANYFAGKTNILNIYFVKIGWFWTTLAFVLIHITNTITRRNAAPRSTASEGQRSRNGYSYYIQTALRYGIITVAWILTTQWFFGPALIDRSFTITGGHCEAPPINLDSSGTRMTSDAKATLDMSFIGAGPACKAAGGRWRGGHDISGHVFLLVLSSASLFYELLIADSHSSHPSVTPRAAANLAQDMSDDEKTAVGGWESQTAAQIRVWARYFLYTVVGLDFWMLLMTAIWFHTWLEKLSGLLLAASTIWVVYLAPEFSTAWRDVVGSV